MLLEVPPYLVSCPSFPFILHKLMERSAHVPPNTIFSIGSFGFNTEILRGDGATLLKPSTAGAVQDDLWYNSSGLKRKRGDSDLIPRTEVSTLSFENDAARVNPGPSLGLCSTSPSPGNSGSSTGSRTTTGNMLVQQGTVDEGPPTSLGLGLTGLSSCSLENGSATSFVSGDGGSMLASADMSICRSADMNSELGNGVSVVLGLGSSAHCQPIISKSTDGARKSFKQANADLFGSELGIELQLGLARRSIVKSDDENVSWMSLGLDTRVDFCNELNLLADDEGSTSARTLKAGGYMPALVMGRTCDGGPCFDQMEMEDHERPQGDRNLVDHSRNGELGSSQTRAETKLDDPFTNLKTSHATTSAGALSASAARTSKTRKFGECGKGSSGASGLCIIHSCRRRCQRQACMAGCRRTHGLLQGTWRSAEVPKLRMREHAEGKTGSGIGHGGGCRCSQAGCTEAARGSSGLCIRHGVGKQCQKESCTKNGEGYLGLRIWHGGGRHCQMDCKKGARGSTIFCKAHGGGKRWMIRGCTKGAEGNTPLCKGHGGIKTCMFDGGGICAKMHGGTSFCVAHGSGNRCAVEGSTRSARGRTLFCVRHDGGKRCKLDNGTGSAQGSRDFCKAYGEGNQCCWGQE